MQLHQRAIVVDAHHDIAIDVLHRRRLGERGSLSGVWGPQLRAGGVKVQILPTFVESIYLPERGLRCILTQIDAVGSDLEEDDRLVQLAATAAEIDSVIANGKIAAVLAVEGCDGLGGDPALLRILYRLGVRMVSLTWNRRNEFADGLGEGEAANGLSQAGRIAVREMGEWGVLCDVSHLAEAGFWDVAKFCRGPFVASHSNARAVCDHPRNLSDDQLRAIAESGGVIGLNFYGAFIDPHSPTLARLADHAAHIADTVGVAHVGVGTDFLEDWLLEAAKASVTEALVDPAMFDLWMPDCCRSEHLPRFSAALLARGFTEDDVEKVLGGNFMRTLRLPARAS